MIRLRNNTGATSKPGYIVAIDPKDPKSFVYVSAGAVKAIGVVMEAVPYRSVCNIATIGERVDVYTTTSVVKGSVLRTVKAGDNRTQGTAVIAKSGDAPYLKVGEALTSGRGFIPIILDFQYAFSSGSSISWGDITGKPNEGSREVTDDTTELSTDRTIVCNKATAMSVDLLDATGSQRIIEIANIGVGDVTIYPYADPSDPSNTDTIDGDTTPIVLATDEVVTIKDYGNNTWKILGFYNVDDVAFRSFTVGVNPDYTGWDDTGHQIMYGNARPWRDELGDALSVQRSGAGITLNLTESTVDFDYNAVYHATPANADMLYKNVQLNHDRDLTASIYPHIHWLQAKNYTPNFLFQYRWQTNGGAKTTAWTFLKCNNLAFTYTAGTIHQISYSNAITPPVGSTLSDVVQFRIYRDTTNASGQFAGSDPYNTGGNASCPVLSFDVHFQINSLGSTDELTK